MNNDYKVTAEAVQKATKNSIKRMGKQIERCGWTGTYFIVDNIIRDAANAGQESVIIYWEHIKDFYKNYHPNGKALEDKPKAVIKFLQRHYAKKGFDTDGFSYMISSNGDNPCFLISWYKYE